MIATINIDALFPDAQAYTWTVDIGGYQKNGTAATLEDAKLKAEDMAKKMSIVIQNSTEYKFDV